MGKEKSNSESDFTENLMLDAECIICAAGFSSRMGRWKVDLKLQEGKSFLENALFTASVCRRVSLVGGYRFEELQKRIPSDFKGRVLENRSYQKGMLTTVQKALEGGYGYFFLMPIDMPLLKRSHLMAVYEKRELHRVVRPSYGGIPGHPVLCPPAWRDKLLRGKGRSPSSVIFREGQFLIPWDDDSVVLDVDTPESYEAYLGRQL